MGYLVLVRHGQSEWNALGLWTGLQDVPLTEHGKHEAQMAAQQLTDITFYKAHTSKLSRAQQTLKEIKQATGHEQLDTQEHEALNERHYGEYTGKNKWEVKDLVGEDEFNKIRRSWNHPVPGGETLKDVHDRVVPYFKTHILNDLKAGKNIIISASGNSLRALMKYLEQTADNNTHELEIGTGQVLVYEISNNGKVIGKQVRAQGGHC